MNSIGPSCICGLGNPGREFAATRHNIGKLVAETLAQCHGVTFKDQCGGQFTQYQTGVGKQYIFIPGSYMNLGGQSLRKFMDFYKLSLDRILVIHDELEIPFGTWHLRTGGGHAGHNGLKSIERECGGKEFTRLRIGIGRPVHDDVANWVLSRFSRDEDIVLPLIIKSITDTLCDTPDLGPLLGKKIKAVQDIPSKGKQGST